MLRKILAIGTFFLLVLVLAVFILNKINKPNNIQKFSASPTEVSPSFSPSPTLLPSKVSLTPTPLPLSSIRLNKSWGAYVGWLDSDVATFESKIGAPMKYLSTFVHWGNENEFPDNLGKIAKSKNITLVLFWEAMDYNVKTPNDPRFSYDAILRGDWETYINNFKEEVKAYGYPVILIPFEEMNGNWYPTSVAQNGNNAQKHIEAYRYLRKFFSGVTNVKFGWDVNGESDPDTFENQIENLYPGDNYVDYVGVNGFNFGEPWLSYHQIFDKALEKLSTFKKPIFIFSMACAPGLEKPNWIAETISEINKNDLIKGWLWFNENKEKDWRIWSDESSLRVFKESIVP